MHSQTQTPANPGNGAQNNAPYYWRPGKTNHYRFTNVWTTIGGSVTMPGSHDGTNSQARFNQPVGLAMNAAGDLFVADTFNHTIRRMFSDGSKWTITTVAGTPGLSGASDGTNGAARFNQPTGITLDSDGNLFVADTLNNTIRKLTLVGRDWVVSTIAGLAGTNGFRDGTNRVARFNRPLGIVAGGEGVVYVADSFNHTIREIKPIGTNWVVKTIAGSPLSPGKADGVRMAARFNEPAGITLDGAGNLYVADELNGTIRKLRLDGTNRVVSTIAGLAGVHGWSDGVLPRATFGSPSAISIDAHTNLYVTDSSNDNIRKMTPFGTNWVVSTLGGRAGARGTNDGPGAYARFNCPCGIAVNEKGSLYYVSDSLNDTIRAGGGTVMQTNIILGRWEQRRGGIVFQHGFYIRSGSLH